jgi:hypothetical protein
VNPRTGESDVASPEGKAAFTASAARDRMVAAGFKCLLALGFNERPGGSSIAGVIQSPDEVLIVAALAYAGRHRLIDALPAILMLFRMYPRDNRWETGAVTHAGGTNASAKAEWMLYFGHPGKRIPRPRVVAAVRAAILALTGREVDDPEDLAILLREPPRRRR